VGWAVMVGWPLWLSRVKGTGSPARDFGLAMRPTDLLLGVGGGLMALGVSVGLALTYTALAGEEAPSNTDILTGDLSELLVVVLLFVIIAIGTPIAEEVFFRGLVLGAGRKRWGTVPGVLFSSLLFGAFHVQPDPVAWLFVGTVTAGYGVVFALMRVWTQGRLAASVVAHMVVNGVAVLAVTLGG
jgi:membrane protease YdiL (CAAX protease family)